VREIAEIIAQVALYAWHAARHRRQYALSQVLAEDPEREKAEGFFFRFPGEGRG
jgi:hypothetical protein